MVSVIDEFKIINEYGFHARPAASFVKAASTFACEIFVEKDGIQVSGKSIMGLLTIEGHQGCMIKIVAKGEDAEDAVRTLGELISSGFGE